MLMFLRATIVENLSALSSLISTKYESQSYTELEQINLVVSFETFADLFTGLLSTAESKDDILVSEGLKVPICSGFQGLGTSSQGFSTNLENDITIYPQEIRRINAHAAGLLEQHLKVHGRLEEAMVEKIDE
ncbi:hypothetical protein N7456_005717 [Penicillium angulare]|uniref:Uncharacterized protein n=1 Tax=Penicillium angulare TaxID=116970 RepID=A0A9W9G0M5_9EURO|nr:hypothetical protein N7456_005717 [Penicillium angulare]